MKLVKQIHELNSTEAFEEDQYLVTMVTIDGSRIWNKNKWSDFSDYLIENAVEFMIQAE